MRKKEMIRYINVVLLCFIITLNGNVCADTYVKHDIEFHLYTRHNPETSYLLKIKNGTNLANSPFHPDHPTIIYIHGYSESVSADSVKTIVKAYLNRNEYNVIVVDWSKLAAYPWYLDAINNTKKVGEHVADFVKWLQRKKLIYIPDLHVIGFSLGAHVAGFMGKKVTSPKVGRITGLDPAAPGFTKSSKDERLNESDATFIDVIHVYANRGKTGLKIPLGHADFYPNKGLEQPACINKILSKDTCNHRLAWKYYAESVLNPLGFPASKCEIWDPIVDNCSSQLDAFMGFGVNVNTRGIFLVETNPKPPFATRLP